MEGTAKRRSVRKCVVPTIPCCVTEATVTEILDDVGL